jgi:hypothetical protein
VWPDQVEHYHLHDALSKKLKDSKQIWTAIAVGFSGSSTFNTDYLKNHLPGVEFFDVRPMLKAKHTLGKPVRNTAAYVLKKIIEAKDPTLVAKFLSAPS